MLIEKKKKCVSKHNCKTLYSSSCLPQIPELYIYFTIKNVAFIRCELHENEKRFCCPGAIVRSVEFLKSETYFLLNVSR